MSIGLNPACININKFQINRSFDKPIIREKDGKRTICKFAFLYLL